MRGGRGSVQQLDMTPVWADVQGSDTILASMSMGTSRLEMEAIMQPYRKPGDRFCGLGGLKPLKPWVVAGLG